MLAHIPALLSPKQVEEFRQALAAAAWTDGRATAGGRAQQVKNNMQVTPSDPVGRRLGEIVVAALYRNQPFVAVALPLKISPPTFNRYEGGQTYGNHVDSAVMPMVGPNRVRSDISATVFLTAPEEYDGGQLVIDDTYGTHGVKLPAGDVILYPGTSLHRVEPVTRGTRVASIFWIESMVRDDGERTMLYNLVSGINKFKAAAPESSGIEQLLSVYNNLVRRWAST